MMRFLRWRERRKSPIQRNRQPSRSRSRIRRLLLVVMAVPILFFLGRLSADDFLTASRPEPIQTPPQPTLEAELPDLPIWRENDSGSGAVGEAERLIQLGQLSRARELLEPLALEDPEAAIALAIVVERMGLPGRALDILAPHRDRSPRVREVLEFAGSR